MRQFVFGLLAQLCHCGCSLRHHERMTATALAICLFLCGAARAVLLSDNQWAMDHAWRGDIALMFAILSARWFGSGFCSAAMMSVSDKVRNSALGSMISVMWACRSALR